jgi:hypothetical protein
LKLATLPFLRNSLIDKIQRWICFLPPCAGGRGGGEKERQSNFPQPTARIDATNARIIFLHPAVRHPDANPSRRSHQPVPFQTLPCCRLAGSGADVPRGLATGNRCRIRPRDAWSVRVSRYTLTL